MHAETQRRLTRRILDHLSRCTTDMIELDATLDAARYYEPARYERERTVLFGRTPLVIAHTSELPEPGDFVTQEVAHTPILLVRGKDATVRAFLNICRHRGTRLVNQLAGRSRGAFTCPYHAWSYNADGSLLHVPHREGFPTLDCAASGLVPLPLQESYGLLWVVPTPNADAAPVPRWLGELDADLTSFGFAAQVVYDRKVERRALNWKLAVDIFLEGYHVKQAHRDSIYPMFFDNIGVYDAFPPHIRSVFPKRSISALATADAATWRLREHANILYFLFPNTLILVQSDHAAVLLIYPDGPDAALLHSFALLPEPPPTEKVTQHWQKNLAILRAAVSEDLALGESIQRGARANRQIRLGRFEQALGYFHAAVDSAIA